MIVRRALATAWMLGVLAGGAVAQEPAPTALGFLEVGKDYVIRFPESSDVFRISRGGVTTSTYTAADGKTTPGAPVPYTFTMTLDVFQVVKVGGGSWVRLRHAASPDDYARWMGQRRARAILAGPHVKAIEAKEGGLERLRKLREAAAAEIGIAESWVNLSHAVAIADVPKEDVEAKLTVTSVKPSP